MIPTSYYTYETAVAYPDVGADYRLNHRGLLRILQEAAAIASDECGFGPKDVPRSGVCWVLTAWRVELTERPLWRSEVAVRTWPRSLEGFASERDFEVFCQGRRIARGTSRWFLVNAATGRIARVTGQVRSAYDLEERAVFDTPARTNGRSSPGAQLACAVQVGRRDIDTNRHVNNIHYLDYALEALPQEVFDHLPDTVEVVYRRQILLGASIRCLYSVTEDGQHQVEIQSGEGDDLVRHAFVWFYGQSG